MIENKYQFECIDCGVKYKPSQVMYLCPECARFDSTGLPPKGVLKVNYNYSKLIDSGTCLNSLIDNSFFELLPINNISSLPKLKIGNTPLYNIEAIDGAKLPFNLFLKDDSQNPTYSFKDRASSIVSAYAKENGFDTIVAASTGNAGSSLAGICASQNQKAIIIVSDSAPLAKLTQILMYGATIIPINGTYDDAFDLSVMATEKFGWYNRNTAYNPFTIEGKKIVSFELFKQLNSSIPDRIFVPVGDGVIISAVFKGFEDLLGMNIIDKMPTIIGVQSESSDNLIRNIDNDEFIIEESTTMADSISVDIPRNFHMAKHYIKKYKGEYLTVSDNEIIEASKILSKNTGLFAEPAAAASFAGMLSYMNTDSLTKNSNNVVLLTGSGLKDLRAVADSIVIPKSINPSIEELQDMID